jgi:hypothetical protein
MPSKTVGIPISNNGPSFEPAALFFSYLAYPDQLDDAQRIKFARALCRWSILKRAIDDKTWASQPQNIRPSIFEPAESEYKKIVHRGWNKFIRHVLPAGYIVWPNLGEADYSRPGIPESDFQ